MDDKTAVRLKYLEDSYHVMSSLIGLLRLELTELYPNTSKMQLLSNSYCNRLKALDEEYLNETTT